ncbi:hypothetical protein CYY_000162 [Polysphondylium violaceum]|uniref:Uncharacterized protein n=1 Tax=Polysphondylium violaceum TaxID=133409 RepID=A0A8J4Q576_9MYCE|nr:hypothetical protein CYY_000162 [Polysphondylium violaceum]
MNTYIENKRSISNTTPQKRAPLSSTTPKKSQFQDAVVAKSDVGEFQGGYFIMPSNDEKMKRPIIPNQQKFSPQRKRLPPVSQFNNQSIVIEEDIKAIKQQQQQQYQQIQKKQQQIHKQLQEQQFNSSSSDDDNLLLTPASFKNNDYNTPSKQQYKQQQQQQQQQKYLSPQPKYTTGSSPPRANSPNKKGITSPSQINCWAGGAFNNSPSPNSLPIPDFGDDSDLVASISQPLEPQQTLEQMSFDLRRLLNITPVAVAGSSN